MKPQELRIGNLVRVYGTIIRVDRIDNYYVYGVDELNNLNTKVAIKHLQGHELTEKWILKLGFEQTMKWTFAINLTGNNILVYYLGEKGVSIGFKNYSDFECRHVHDLQNLYFDLTGKELTVKQ